MMATNKQEEIAPCGVNIYQGSILPMDMYQMNATEINISIQKHGEKDYAHFCFGGFIDNHGKENTIAVWRIKPKQH